MQNQSRQLAAILFTDIIGYTAMMQQNEVYAVAIVRHYITVLKTAVAAHAGEILNDYGDGSLCVFSSATNAVNCAMELQRQLQQKPSVPLRIGIHIGEIFFEDGKVFGDGVNVASRIQSLGQANTILFSGEINNKIKNNPEFKSVSIGRFEFKNVDDPVEVFALANEGFVIPEKEKMSGKLKDVRKKSLAKKLMLPLGVAILLIIAIFAFKVFSKKNNVAGKDLTIAILPFKNISINKEENEPFCVGVTLELQKKLEWLRGLIPIASQSVEKYRDTKMSVADIAHELGDIKYIVQGTVQRDKNKVKVFVSLVDAVSGKQLWDDYFPGEVEDVFSLQENIAQQIASALQVKITPDEKNRIERVPTKNTKALDAYNEALSSYLQLIYSPHPMYWDELSSNNQLYLLYRKVLSLCDQAIEIDPGMAEAYALKGKTYNYKLSDWFNSKDHFSLLDSVAFWANKTIDIDKTSTDAYVLLSKCFQAKKQSDSALINLEKALTINNNNFDVNWELGRFYSFPDYEKSIRFLKKAIRLDPFSTWTSHVYHDLAFTYHNLCYFEKAEIYYKKSLELSNNSMTTKKIFHSLTNLYLHWGKADSVFKYANQLLKIDTDALYNMAEAYCNLKNDCTKAAQLYEQLWNRYRNHVNLHRWAVALMNSGKIEEAKEKIQLAFKEFRDRNDTLSYDYAGICALNGEKEKAIQILRKWSWDWGSLYLIQHDKLFDNIRNEKEFKEILQKALDEKKKLRDRIKKMEESGEL
jgi:TolB-like protein/tetratricopeptide (TPR) repeat protein